MAGHGEGVNERKQSDEIGEEHEHEEREHKRKEFEAFGSGRGADHVGDEDVAHLGDGLHARGHQAALGRALGQEQRCGRRDNAHP